MLFEEQRAQTLGEEIANSISHGVAALLVLIFSPALIFHAAKLGSTADLITVIVFSVVMFILYMMSCLYHAMPRNRSKSVFQILDHSAIFLLIAGTYTPFTLSVLKGAWGWSLFGIVWVLAILGIVLKSVRLMKYPWLSTGLYLVMGWLALVAIKPLLQNINSATLLWLVLGGVFYTVGTIFFVLDEKYKYAHFIWHLFVMIGTGCHIVSVYSIF